MKVGDVVQCEELATGQRNAAVFDLRRDRILTQVYRFDSHLHINEADWLHLRTAKNEFISLGGNAVYSAGASSRFSPSVLTTYCQEILSNTALIGPDQWQATDQVHSINFSIPGSGNVFDHKELLQRIARADLGWSDDNSLFSVECDTCKVSVWYAAEHQIMRGFTTDIQPRFDVSLKQPGSLDCAFGLMMDVVEFVSAVTGRLVEPTDIFLWRGQPPDSEAKDWDRTIGPYACHFLWLRPMADAEERGYLGLAYAAWDSEEVAALRDALTEWLRRADNWHNANQLMMQALRFRKVLTPERMLNASKWLEEIPGTGSHDVISDEHLGQISKAAKEKAAALGLGSLNGRIHSAIKRLKSETHQQRFARLVQDLESRFDTRVFRPSLIDDLIAAQSYRGVAAHAHMTLQSTASFQAFNRAIGGVEALCFLLTLKDLPPSPHETNRLTQHAFLRDYLIAY